MPLRRILGCTRDPRGLGSLIGLWTSEAPASNVAINKISDDCLQKVSARLTVVGRRRVPCTKRFSYDGSIEGRRALRKGARMAQLCRSVLVLLLTVKSGKAPTVPPMLRRSIAACWAAQGYMLRCTRRRRGPIILLTSLIRINAGAFGGNWLVLAEFAHNNRNWIEPALRKQGCGGRHEFARHQGKWASVKAALGCRDRARCAFLRIVALCRGESVNAAWRNGAFSKAGRR
jgi:hypothetical protein